ncbi:MAG: sporulation protein YunB [Firmicutes bacterium]|nr:sporulation protein YunB [Bacillota bacterium]
MRPRWPVPRSSYYRRSARIRRRARPLRRRAGQRGCAVRILAAAVLTAGVLIFLNVQLRPMLQSAVAQQAGQVSVQTVNFAVQKVLNENPLPGDYLTVERADDGTIRSVDVDTASVNRLKTELNLSIQQALNELGDCSVAVPLGTLLGGSLLRGLGPNVPLRFTVVSNAFCDLVSSFDSAGINQSRHTLSLAVTTEVYAVIPGCSAKNTVETTFPVAETIIVGKVPDLYWSRTAEGSSAGETAVP